MILKNGMTANNDPDFTPYHNGKGWRKPVADTDRDFVLWDGEGITYENDKPQEYVLFGCYDGKDHFLVKAKALTAKECLALIIEVGRTHPKTWHVSFAFGYDVTMIVKTLPKMSIMRLRQTERTRYMGYSLEYIPGKWFRVSKDNVSVTIYDIWGYFQCSLVAALKSYIPDHPLMSHLPEIEEGKGNRGSFTWEDIDYVERYWRIENELGYHLTNRLREYLYNVDLRITKWHGPGSIASYTYKRENVHDHRVEPDPRIYHASRYGYAGGRFEVFRIGRHLNAFSYDINSAYPEAISLLPSLREGFWHYVEEPGINDIPHFAIYHVRTGSKVDKVKLDVNPLFHRDMKGNITFQQLTEGWYWAPEIQAMLDTGCHVEFIEGWEYRGWRTYPFEFVRDMYEQRRALKALGNGSQMALKLALNSLYGKMAQRAGWERNGKAPTWHQLEWAGWVTSYTRAKLYRLMSRIPWDQIIAVETDGLFSTATPEQLGIVDSKELGGWEVNFYDELVYLQSGVYAKREGKDWSCKFRGLDKDSLTPLDIVNHSRILTPNEKWWYPIEGVTTRFIGMRHAIFRERHLHQGPMKLHMGKWETEKRAISSGSEGKRQHIIRLCAACKAGATAYEQPHDLAPMTKLPIMSQPHDIPWLDQDASVWRDRQDAEAELVSF